MQVIKILKLLSHEIMLFVSFSPATDYHTGTGDTFTNAKYNSQRVSLNNSTPIYPWKEVTSECVMSTV